MKMADQVANGQKLETNRGSEQVPELGEKERAMAKDLNDKDLTNVSGAGDGSSYEPHMVPQGRQGGPQIVPSPGDDTGSQMPAEEADQGGTGSKSDPTYKF
jgi:hypothetical protein